MSIGYILSNNSLIPFDTSNPDNPNSAIAITGLGTGENLVGIDVRPQNGKLYGLTSNGSGVRLYVISTQTGVATPLTTAPVQLDNGSGNPVAIQGANFGIDFNPTVDRLRVVTDGGVNFRMNPNTGAVIDGDNGSATAVPGTNPDGSINVNGTAATVDATAYTNNAPNVTVTTQYTLDAATNRLLIQNPPNSGAQTVPRSVTLNGAALDFTAVNGFDIPSGISVTTSNTPATGRALAALTVNGTSGLYAIELSTGAATRIGTLGTGTQPVQGFAVQSEAVPKGTPLIGLDATGTNLLRFNSATPTTVTTIALNSIPTGESIVGIDLRPATGQLFALSVNATANTASLLIIDPQTGAATPVGNAGQIALVDATGNPIDLPASGYGIDFNPTVDRLRIVTSTGLNFRIDPNTGAAVDSDTNATGINPDNGINISGAAGTVDATAYTNSFAGATATTQYTLDANTNRLFIQTPPNNGSQTNSLAVTLNGAALDFTAVNGFDIPANVRVGTSNSPATGRGLAALTVGGNTGLYAIELSTGAATLLGSVGTGTTGLAGLTAAEAPTGSVAFDKATYSVAENGKSIAINLVRTEGSSGALSVNVAATGGTATATTDYSGLPTTVQFADGQTTATANITIADDAIAEGDETVVLTLSNPAGTVNPTPFAALDSTTLTITDDERRTVRGTRNAETLRGSAANDLILGLGGNDRLIGLAGSDGLQGGKGADRLIGGDGGDRYLYSGKTQRAAYGDSLLASADRIVGFNSTQGDRIQLDDDADLTTVDQPLRLYNAGLQDDRRLVNAIRSAYQDKNQRRDGNQALKANEAVFVSFRKETYLIVNDSQNAFSNNRDLIVNTKGIAFNSGDAKAGVLSVTDYFA